MRSRTRRGAAQSYSAPSGGAPPPRSPAEVRGTRRLRATAQLPPHANRAVRPDVERVEILIDRRRGDRLAGRHPREQIARRAREDTGAEPRIRKSSPGSVQPRARVCPAVDRVLPAAEDARAGVGHVENGDPTGDSRVRAPRHTPARPSPRRADLTCRPCSREEACLPRVGDVRVDELRLRRASGQRPALARCVRMRRRTSRPCSARASPER